MYLNVFQSKNKYHAKTTLDLLRLNFICRLVRSILSDLF